MKEEFTFIDGVSTSLRMTDPLPTSPFAGGGADRDSYRLHRTVPSPAKGRVRVGSITVDETTPSQPPL